MKSETVQTSLAFPIQACQITLLTTYSLLRWCLIAETRVWQPPCDTFCLLWCSRTVFSAHCKKKKTSKGHRFYTAGRSVKPGFHGKKVQKKYISAPQSVKVEPMRSHTCSTGWVWTRLLICGKTETTPGNGEKMCVISSNNSVVEWQEQVLFSRLLAMWSPRALFFFLTNLVVDSGYKTV